MFLLLITNLISISGLRQKGVYWRANTLTLYLTFDNQQFARCKEIAKLFTLEDDNAAKKAIGGSTSLLTIKMPPLSIDQVHRCFSHLREVNPRKPAAIAETEIYSILSPCKACILAKITKTIIRSQATLTFQIIDLFYNDLVGLITSIGYNEALYFQIAKDDYSHIVWGGC